MAKIDVTRTELVWPGKFNEDGSRREAARVNLPFQVIEMVNESRATREEQKKPANQDLFNYMSAKEGNTFEDGWKNKLIWGDNLLVMGSLLEKFAGKIDLIYIDPPFATGTDFSFKVQIGESGEEVSNEQTIIEEKAYRDTWRNKMNSYLTMMYDRLVLMRELLTDHGSIYVHCDWRVNSYVRLAMDEIFQKENLVNEIIWCYTGPGSPDMRQFNRKQDTIFWFSKGDKWIFNKDQVRIPYKDPKQSLRKAFDSGRGMSEEEAEKYRQRGKVPETWWEDIAVAVRSKQNINYPTQKPEALLERIIKASSDEGNLVADFFCGSGTTAAVSEKLGRRWITCDLGRWGVHTTRKRMLGIEGCKPFEVLNLGKYERQYWQGITFDDAKKENITEQVLYQYLAFILKLYGAQPISGMTHLHGKKGKALVHIGAVDAPVTINQINQAVDEILRLKQKELHVLGWEWEMGLNGLVTSDAKTKGIKLTLLKIPREVMDQQAVDRGDVRFFELAYLNATIKKSGNLSAQVELQDFVISDVDVIPDKTRDKISKWDYIDYWAVDWDFQGDTFMQGWVAYRTRKERQLPLVSDEHAYAKAGKYRVLIKVIDIFGNDTSQMLTIKLK